MICLAWVVRKVDNAIHRIKRRVRLFFNTYELIVIYPVDCHTHLSKKPVLGPVSQSPETFSYSES